MFETLLSNKNMKEQLGFALKTQTVLHAYLFCGPEGSGKKTAALAFAAEIIGDKDRVLRHSHPDVIFLHPEEDKKSISVEAVRDMRADAFITPTEAAKKVYIIDAFCLNEAGQNALLTVLEQPPSFCVFILLVHSREKILPTVISRCSVYEMEYVNDDEGAQLLSREINAPKDKLKTYMKAAQGNVGLAAKMATDESFSKLVDVCESVCVAIAQKDRYTIAKTVLPIKKDKIAQFLQVLTVYLRDILILNSTGNADALVFCDSVLKNKSIFAKIDTDRLYNCIQQCQTSLYELDGSVNLSLITATLTINLYGGKTLD